MDNLAFDKSSFDVIWSEAFLKKYDYVDEVKEFIEADMYNRFKDYYSYVFYIAKKK
ncbi:hypothetical protein N4T77_01470 [Clostridium sp. CX1]|uniref:SAM-dependent methyltransferase n=1 Tax=Clostridium tanneri TaxID=3037988 RepID=A0ABU4JVZ1_9CLOT|nr:MULTISPECIES: hypothetical protein [unclassified Clostridium]MCT8975259.1 hypothetical protein [Clostridium sp. CX1]MDW8802103.1 hypothetical protein [Clostridium sp. A1-XYC3]